MPAARSPADILCLALYTLAEGRIMRGFMLTTVGRQLGFEYDQVEKMAIAAAAAGLVRHEAGTVTLTGEGRRAGRR
jgi:hypothetical protein